MSGQPAPFLRAEDRAVTARGKALSGRKKRRIKPLHIPDLPYIRDEALKKGAES